MEYLYLLPIVFMIHEFEEIIMLAQSETLGDCVKILIFAS